MLKGDTVGVSGLLHLGRRAGAGSARRPGRATPAPSAPEGIDRIPVGEVERILATDATRGLTAFEAADRLARWGPNDPAPANGLRWPAIAARQLSSLLVIVLLVAMAISAALGEYLNAFAIGITVIVAATFGFLTEYRSERATAALRALTAQQAEVVRGGLHEDVPSFDLVPGDLVVLSEGRTVPADVRIVESHGLLVNEAILTGESEDAAKSAVFDPAAASLSPATLAFAGTTVVAGSALAIVAATGAATSLGSIVATTRQAGRRATPLETRLEELGKRLVAVFLAACLIISLIGIVQGREPRLMVELAVALAIGAVPEGLPAVATISLAVAVHRLARSHVLVRRLDAVEALGATTVIVTDKTGTLTLNRMAVRAVVLPDGREAPVTLNDAAGPERRTRIASPSSALLAPVDEAAAIRVLGVAALCSDAVAEWDAGRGWHAHGDPSEAALVLAAAGLQPATGIDNGPWDRVKTTPFTAASRVMQTTHRGPEGETLIALKGGYEAVAARCQSSPAPLAAASERLARQGYRLFAVAEAVADGHFRMLGLVVLHDPLRPGAAAAVAACRDAGIRLILATGDHVETARNIALETGILAPAGSVIEGNDLATTPLEAISVVARATHRHKEDLVSRLQQAGETVAMTGDGVNDAPALRSADVGIAVGPGASDVAVEASDVLLSDGRLASLVDGIREGRQVALNLRQAIVYLLTASFGTILAMTFAIAAADELPLAPLQILWLNLVVHIFPALALATGRELKANLHQPAGQLMTAGTWLEVAWRAFCVGAAAFGALVLNIGWGETAQHGQSLVFASLALALVGQSLLIGVTTFSEAASRLRRVELELAVAVSTGLMFAAIYAPGLSDALDLETMEAGDWAAIVGFALLAWIGGQAGGRLYRLMRPQFHRN